MVGVPPRVVAPNPDPSRPIFGLDVCWKTMAFLPFPNFWSFVGTAPSGDREIAPMGGVAIDVVRFAWRLCSKELGRRWDSRNDRLWIRCVLDTMDGQPLDRLLDTDDSGIVQAIGSDRILLERCS